MPLSILHETITALGGESLDQLQSRSLLFDRFGFDRFAERDALETARKNWFRSVIQKAAQAPPSDSGWLPQDATILYARLMGRLMVNMGGGVMENANLKLNRYGLPVIPGSALKGCARRMALQALHDWVASGGERPQADDACAPCCREFTSPASMLTAIARVFGWVELDWRSGTNRDGAFASDFAWACGDAHEAIWKEACQSLAQHFGLNPGGDRPWTSLPSFAGSIAFLPATPNTDPGLELDVVTPHHGKYYRQEIPVALDTEEPVPVLFPAVKTQKENDAFSFLLRPLRPNADQELAHARNWLRHGLELFGLGAKTNAGYGWFDASPEFNEQINTHLRQQRENERAAELQAKEAADEKQKQKEAQDKKAAEQAALAGLSPDQQADWRLEQLSDAQFDAKVRAFCKLPKKGGPSDEEKNAIVRALKGPRLDYWKVFKTKATKGELATAEQAIRALNTKLHGDKMP
jgi:CRISPR-associated protein Cmr6